MSSAGKPTEFRSIEQLFEKESELCRRQQEHYDKLVHRILDAIMKKVKRSGSLDDDKFMEYHFTGISFPGYNDKRCVEYVLEELRRHRFLATFLEDTRKFFISWEHYVPQYKRQVIMEQTGIVLDEFGCFVRNLHDGDPELLRQQQQERERKLLELRKQELEDSQFQQLGRQGVYNESMLNPLRNVYQQRK